MFSPPFAPEGRSWFPLSPLTGFPNGPFGHFFGNFSKIFFSRLMLRSFRSVGMVIPSRTKGRGAAAHGEKVPGTTKSAHTGIKACMGAWAHFNIENVGGCRMAWASQRSRRAINYAFIVVSNRISGPSCIFPSYTWAPFQSKWGIE